MLNILQSGIVPTRVGLQKQSKDNLAYVMLKETLQVSKEYSFSKYHNDEIIAKLKSVDLLPEDYL
jgi:hypothetical protein